MDEVTTGSTLYTKMSRVMGMLERIPKNGFNQHFKYAFVTDADVVDTVRTAMASEGLAFFASMDSIHQEGKRTVVNIKLTFADGESGDTMSVNWIGEANDSQDKGVAKAATSAVKYALLKTFLISTGDDPDSDNDGPSEEDRTEKKLVPKKSAPKKKREDKEITASGRKGPKAVKMYLLSEALKIKQRPINAQDIERIVPLLNGVLGDNDKRKAWLKWTYDIDSSKLLTGAQKDILWRDLKPTYTDKKWIPTTEKGERLANAIRAMYQESLKESIKNNVQQMRDSVGDAPEEELGDM